MTPTQLKRALSLYSRFKCDTEEYRRLAAAASMTTAQLNAYLHPIYREKKAKMKAKK